MAETSRDDEQRGSIKRVIRAGVLVFLILLVILAVVAWFAGDALLPVEYEGFD